MNQKLSSLRKKLNQTQRQIDQLLDAAKVAPDMVPASLYQLKRKCGKQNCRCTKGQLHASTVLSYRGQQKKQTIIPPAEHLQSIKQMTDDYRRHRERRAQLVKLQQQAIKLVDQIQEICVKQGEKRLQKMRADSSSNSPR